MSITSVKRTTDIDKQIGSKIMEIRLAKCLNRETIAKQIGVTHQQFQKYEKGTNRLSVVRLLGIAKVLETDPSYFYSDSMTDGHDVVADQPRIRMNLELVRNLQAIDSQEIQDAVVHLTKKLADLFKQNKENKK